MLKITIAVLLYACSYAMACGKGCELHGNVCACEPSPAEMPQDVKPSTEAPPRGNGEHVKAAMPDSLIYSDSHLDQEKVDADVQGKKAAGL